jgi:hypothetical protein
MRANNLSRRATLPSRGTVVLASEIVCDLIWAAQDTVKGGRLLDQSLGEQFPPRKPA